MELRISIWFLWDTIPVLICRPTFYSIRRGRQQRTHIAQCKWVQRQSNNLRPMKPFRNERKRSTHQNEMMRSHWVHVYLSNQMRRNRQSDLSTFVIAHTHAHVGSVSPIWPTPTVLINVMSLMAFLLNTESNINSEQRFRFRELVYLLSQHSQKSDFVRWKGWKEQFHGNCCRST